MLSGWETPAERRCKCVCATAVANMPAPFACKVYGPGATARKLTPHTPRAFPRPHTGNIIDLSAFNGQADTLAVRTYTASGGESVYAPSLLTPRTPNTLTQLAMLCALVGSSLWVNNASRLGLPVSTSHSIVGATIGVGLAFKGPKSVLWGDARHGVASIVLSWIISPLAAALFGAIIWSISKYVVLKAPQPAARMTKLFPLYMTATCSVVISFMVIAGAPRLKLSAKDKNGVVHVTNPGGVAGVIIALCFVVAVAAYFIQRMPWFSRWLESLPKQDHGYDAEHHRMLTADETATVASAAAPDAELGAHAAEKDALFASSDTAPLLPPAMELTSASGSTNAAGAVDTDGVASASGGAAAGGENAALGSKLKNLALSGINADVTSPVDAAAVEAHNMAVRYDDAAERLFTACQVFTASFASLAHGSNDVANAVAPLAVISGIWRSGGSTVSGNTPTPTWCLAYGGLFIDVGLMLFGYKVMRSLGNNITYHSPSRGFSMELSALITVLWASSIGAVVSTTHVITGATVGVGLCSAGGKLKAINWRMVGVTMFGWILTLPAAALVSGVLFAILAHSPHALTTAQARPGVAGYPPPPAAMPAPAPAPFMPPPPM